MIGQTSRHRRWRGKALLVRFPQFMMHKAPIVRRANQVHTRFNGLQTPSSMTALARKDSQPFPHRATPSFNTGGIEHRPALRLLQQSLRLLIGCSCHRAAHLDHPLVVGALDDSRNTQRLPGP